MKISILLTACLSIALAIIHMALSVYHSGFGQGVISGTVFSIVVASQNLRFLKNSAKERKYEALIYNAALLFSVIYWLNYLREAGYRPDGVSIAALLAFVATLGFNVFLRIRTSKERAA